ncbi:3-hydroxyisobutyrate dehydrogenase [Violaceomyces palustris]|uniref:3-hydroxyisobutyrate dehydrogenase n=1 Tax=Violaceomyces palustris TaxID=1673888 RepID=A0ACD0NN47_9BASI|nr:3-hydroxyisobutyrate dehydrogenase [Violaceomyces palustris]
MTLESSDQIAFVGLGNMGLPMAVNLVKQGYKVKAFDLKEESKRQFLLESQNVFGGSKEEAVAAARVGEDVKDCCQGSRYLILMVVNDLQARSILFSNSSEVLKALEPRSKVILMATCKPDAVVELAKDVAKVRDDLELIDAPVSGGVSGAKSGGLTIMVACRSEVLQASKKVLDCLGTKIYHVGEEVGKGQSMKAVNQVLCGIHVAAAAEALSLSTKAGIDPSLALEIVSGSAASSWMLKDRGPRMLQSSPEVRSMIDIFVKDLDIVAQAGKAHGAALPLSVAAHQMFVAAKARGQGSQDDSSVIKSYWALNGTDEKDVFQAQAQTNQN